MQEREVLRAHLETRALALAQEEMEAKARKYRAVQQQYKDLQLRSTTLLERLGENIPLSVWGLTWRTFASFDSDRLPCLMNLRSAST